MVLNMKKTAAALLCILLLTASAPLFSNAADESASISPALEIIAGRLRLAKTALSGESIRFSSGDFDDCVGTSVESVTILSLPLPTDGTLLLASAPVSAGQTISRRDLKYLSFMPAGGAETTASFTFTAEGGSWNGTISCMLYNLDEANLAPTALLVNDSYFSVRCYRDVDYYGVMKALDPEGDGLSYEIVSPPKKGALTVTDRSAGSYVYSPLEGYRGHDSFKYVAVDSYGNRSNAVTVSVDIETNSSQIVYSDLEGHWAYTAAIAAAEAGIMSGSTENIFSPDDTVTRAEFLTIAMKAAGYNVIGSSVTTSFVDNDEIPAEYLGYTAAALKLGFIHGIEAEDGLYFRPNEPITRCEAAVILTNILELPSPQVRAVFADSDSLPAWAADSLCALSDSGIFNGTGGGYISPYSVMTRAQTAQTVCNILAIKD